MDKEENWLQGGGGALLERISKMGRGGSGGAVELERGLGGRVAGGVRSLPSFGSSPSDGSSSSGGRDQPPRRRARLEGGSGPSRRRASVKREEGSD